MLPLPARRGGRGYRRSGTASKDTGRSTRVQRSRSSAGAGTARRFTGGAAVLGVDALRFLELVLEDHDAARGLDRGPLVDELAGARGDPQLVAGVPAVSSLRAERSDQTSLTDGSEEGRGGAEHLGCPAHRVRGVVVVVQTIIQGVVRCHVTSLCNASR